MLTIFRLTFFALLFTLFSSTILAQNNYPFNNDRTIVLDNYALNSDQVTIYLQFQSTSTSQRDGHGSYARILGSSNYFLELADHKGELALYNGRTWYDLGIDIRKETKNIFLIFDKGMIKIFDGNKLIAERKHVRNTFSTKQLFIGGSFTKRERLTGQIDHFAIYPRILKSEEIKTILKGFYTSIQKTYPAFFYDFLNGMDLGGNQIPKNIGLKKQSSTTNIQRITETADPVPDMAEPENSPNVMDDIVEAPPAYGDEPEMYEPAPNTKKEKMKMMEQIFGTNFEVKFSDIDRINWKFEGKIKSNLQLIEPGSYDMIIDANGNVTIKIKTVEDK